MLTSDRQQAIDGNRLDNKNSSVFFYFAERALKEMTVRYDRSRMLQCMNEIKQWKMIDELSDSSYRNFALDLARAMVPIDVPFNQYVFATKVNAFLFIAGWLNICIDSIMT